MASEAFDPEREDAAPRRRRLLPWGGRGEKPAPEPAVEAPVQISFGYQEGSQKDVESIARDRCMTKFAKEISFYATAKFASGYLFECHEGGAGVGYLPQIVERLSHDMAAGEVLVPNGERLFKIAMRDGRPVCLKLSEQESRAARAAAEFPVATGKMKPAVRAGEGVVQVGAAVMIFGTIVLFASIGYYFVTTSNQPGSRPLAYEQLPHRQWDSIKRLRNDQYVNRLRYVDGRWQIDFAEIVRPQPAPPPPAAPRPPMPPQPQGAPAPATGQAAPTPAPAPVPLPARMDTPPGAPQ